MKTWKTISGKFDKGEIPRIREYIEREGASVNELVRKAVMGIVTKNIDIREVDNYLPNKKKRYTEVVSGRLSEEDISGVDTYLLNYKVSYNSLIRYAVFYFIDNNIPLKNKEDTCLLTKKLPSVEEIVDVLSKIADKNPTQKSKSAKRMGAWREWFENTGNIELLASVFWNK